MSKTSEANNASNPTVAQTDQQPGEHDSLSLALRYPRGIEQDLDFHGAFPEQMSDISLALLAQHRTGGEGNEPWIVPAFPSVPNTDGGAEHESIGEVAGVLSLALLLDRVRS